MRTVIYCGLTVFALVSCSLGCLSVKTEHEVKPIHITMDINLKIDKELDNFFGDIDNPVPGEEKQ